MTGTSVIRHLFEVPEALPVLARWFVEEWGPDVILVYAAAPEGQAAWDERRRKCPPGTAGRYTIEVHRTTVVPKPTLDA